MALMGLVWESSSPDSDSGGWLVLYNGSVNVNDDDGDNDDCVLCRSC